VPPGQCQIIPEFRYGEMDWDGDGAAGGYA
jgi:hypothetical protein